MNNIISDHINDVPHLKKVVKLYDDPINIIPPRLIDIDSTVSKYFTNEISADQTNIRQLKDKYKNELIGFTYVSTYDDLVVGKEIILISKKTKKISKRFVIVGFSKNMYNITNGIQIKLKLGKVARIISMTRNYVFKYDGVNPILRIIDNI